MAATTIGHTEDIGSAKAVLSGSLAEGVSSGAVVVLTLLGLSGIMPALMLALATIVMAAAFLLEGEAISMRFSKLLAETSKDRLDEAELGVGLTSEVVGGIAGLVLGILSLLKLYPMYLVPVAVIVYGGILMFSSGMTVRLNALEFEGIEENSRFKRITHEAMRAAAGVEFLLGLSAVVLGIIALTGTYTAVLSLVALLVVGVTGFFTGAAVSTRMYFNGIQLFKKQVERIKKGRCHVPAKEGCINLPFFLFNSKRKSAGNELKALSLAMSSGR
jgi:hypothetical protein